MPVRALVARTPQKIEVVEVHAHIIPAGIAGMEIDNAVRGMEFIGRIGEARDHHHGYFAAPGQPGKAAGYADEEISVLDDVNALLEGLVARKVFGPVGDMVPDQPLSMHAVAIHAEDAIAAVLEEFDHIVPALRIVPVFGLAGTLHGNTHIGFLDLARR